LAQRACFGRRDAVVENVVAVRENMVCGSCAKVTFETWWTREGSTSSVGTWVYG
jgi:hypothetical protein